MIKVDVKNAFDEIAPAAIINVVRNEIPAIQPYDLFLFTMSSVDDSRTGKTSVHKMTTGKQLEIAPYISRAQLAHRIASVYLIADDNMAVDDFHSQDDHVTLATTTDSNNIIYGLGTQYTYRQ